MACGTFLDGGSSRLRGVSRTRNGHGHRQGDTFARADRVTTPHATASRDTPRQVEGQGAHGLFMAHSGT